MNRRSPRRTPLQLILAVMTKTKAIFAGLAAGLLGGIIMTTSMSLLAALRVATPLVIIGDRLSVFIPPGPFLSLMGKVGGYNHLKQLGVGSTIAGQFVVGAIGGAIFGWFVRRTPGRIATISYGEERPLVRACERSVRIPIASPWAARTVPSSASST